MTFNNQDIDLKTSILEERAKEFAKKISKDIQEKKGSSFLIFALGQDMGEKYALSYQYVDKVVALPTLTRVPGIPNVFLGVTYHNAQIWPVIDTDVLLGISTNKLEQSEYIILLRDGKSRYALTVDYVFGHEYLDLESSLTQINRDKESASKYVLGICGTDISVLNDKAVINFLNNVPLGQNK
ncbi:MAG: CheW domain-containing protein [Legionellaceae bacterium]|nr:CheW domain-containing protein [Legionellaceae bacterium]